MFSNYYRKGFVESVLGASLISVLSGGCTYYTDCPCANAGKGGGTNAGTDGGGTGGTTTGGSGGSGGIGGDPVPGEWTDATGSLVGHPAGFANVCYVTSEPGSDRLIAGVSEAGLFASTNGGADWDALGTAEGSAVIGNRTGVIIFDPEDSAVFWEAGSHGGIYRTDDDGESFVLLGDANHVDAVTVDLTDPERRTLYTNGHEQGTLYRSTDAGDVWESVAPPPGSNTCAFPYLVDSETVLVGCSRFGGNLGGIFRSIDLGETWVRVSTTAAWEMPLLASDGGLYWATEAGEGMLRSDDGGLTWSEPLGSTRMLHPIELPDGKIASVNGRVVVVSDDRGETWVRATPDLAFDPVGIAYSDADRAFYSWHLSTEPEIPAGAIVTFAYDYEAN